MVIIHSRGRQERGQERGTSETLGVSSASIQDFQRLRVRLCHDDKEVLKMVMVNAQQYYYM